MYMKRCGTGGSLLRLARVPRALGFSGPTFRVLAFPDYSRSRAEQSIGPGAALAFRPALLRVPYPCQPFGAEGFGSIGTQLATVIFIDECR